MRKIALILILSCFSANIFAQVTRKQAQENPLDCLLYLLPKRNSDIAADELSRILFNLRRFDDARFAISFVDNSYSRILLLTQYSNQLHQFGESTQANKLIDDLLKIVATTDDYEFESQIPSIVPVLIKANREDAVAGLISLSDDDDIKAKAFLAAANTYQEIGNYEKSQKFAEDALPMANWDIKSELAKIFLKIDKKKASEIANHLEKDVFVDGDAYDRKNYSQWLIRFYLQQNNPDKAFQLWQQYGNPADKYQVFEFADGLVNFGFRDRAMPFVLQLREDKSAFENQNGKRLVELLLKVDDIENVVSFAKTMSENDDSYQQQTALMSIADRFINEGKPNSAIEIIDFAFQRAKRVSNEHNAMDSVGASPGSRKGQYLSAIYTRLMSLKQYKKAALLIGLFKDAESNARFITNFAKNKIGILPRQKIYEMITTSQNFFKKDEFNYDFQKNENLVQVADVYALLGEKDKAISILTDVLVSETADSYSYQCLYEIGRVFNERKLTANPKLRKVLNEIITENTED